MGMLLAAGVGKRLIKTRKHLGLSRIQVAEKAFVSDSTLKQAETGARVPPNHSIDKAAVALGADPAFIRYGTPAYAVAADAVSLLKALEEVGILADSKFSAPRTLLEEWENVKAALEIASEISCDE